MKFKYILLFSILLFSLNFISAGWCYQEQTNNSNARDGSCGLNYSGKYIFQGIWLNPNNIIDTNWATYGSGSNSNMLNFTYYKPLNTSLNTSVWQVKDNLGTVNLSFVTLDAVDCFNQNPIKLAIRTGSSCFSEDTKIKTLFGEKDIKDIKEGDYVLSYDENIQMNVYSKVTETSIHEENEIDSYLLINKDLKVTSNHIIFINNNWLEIGEAKVGDNLTDYNKNNILIYSIELVNESMTTYNLEVENTHNYYANGLLVHNKPYPLKWSCWTGTTFKDLRSGTLSFLYNIYEEAMIWDVTTAPLPDTNCWTYSNNLLSIPLSCGVVNIGEVLEEAF